MENECKRRVIALSDARPVAIVEGAWPTIGSARGIEVLEHADGRRIVFGTFTDLRGHKHAGGYLVNRAFDATDEAGTVAAVLRLAEDFGDKWCGVDVLASMKPQDLA